METTLNIRLDLLDQISKAAKIQGISRSDMIFNLLTQATAEIKNPARMGTQIRYQKRCMRGQWHIFHVQVREDMYEYWLDLRKLMKMSVSLILANAVKKYLGRQNKIINTDSYLCKNYMIIKEVIDSVIVWKLVWGWPPHLEKLIH